MIYGSVCSGIEAATVAWHALGWSPAFFSEIEKFPSMVLAHHYGSNMPGETPSANGVPNYGDMTRFGEWPIHEIDCLVGGTPCQSYSIAGLRKGLDDPRGSLMLTYLALARRYNPRWLVWENVPGVLSCNRGRDFGTFLAGLAQCGFGFAYRVLDASGFGSAAPRPRVFVVGHNRGDWRQCAAVLFDRSCFDRDLAAKEETAPVFTRKGGMAFDDRTPCILEPDGIRRATPLEWERALGFPDRYTDISPSGKSTPDGPRYNALGNSMDVRVMRWIGERIAMVEEIEASL